MIRRVRWDRLAVMVPAGLMVIFLGKAAAAVTAFDYATYRPWESRIEPEQETVVAGIDGRFAVLVDRSGFVRVYDVATPPQPVMVDRIRAWIPGSDDISVAAASRDYLMIDHDMVYVYRVLPTGRLDLYYLGWLREPAGHYFNGACLATGDEFVFIAGERFPGSYPNLFVFRPHPEDPTDQLWPVGLAHGSNQPLATAAVGSRLFVSSLGGLGWFDFDPAGDLIASGNVTGAPGCVALATDGGVVAGVDGRGNLVVLDAAGPAVPAVVGQAAIGGDCAALALRGDDLLLADTRLGIRRLSLADRRHPVVLDTIYTGSGARGVGFCGAHRAASSPSGGLMLIDPQRLPPSPVRGTVPWITGGFAAAGAMVCGPGRVDGQKRLVLADVAVPGTVRLVDSIPFEWPDGVAYRLAMSDSLVAVGRRDAYGFYSVMLARWNAADGFTDPYLVALAGAVGADFDVQGTRFHLATPSGPDISHLVIRDARDPWRPVELQRLTIDGTACALGRVGDDLWCASYRNEESYLHVIDVSTPGQAVVRAISLQSGRIRDLDVQQDRIAAIVGRDGPKLIRLLDTSKPIALQVLAEIPIVAETCLQAGAIAYVSTPTDLRAYTLADPRHPTLIGTLAGPMPCVAATPNGVLAGGDGGLLVLAPQVGAATAVPPAAAPAALRLEPNPFNPRLTIRLAAPGAGPLTCQIFDARGRRVWKCDASRSTAGDFVAAWDGRDATGAAAPTGTYLVRVTTAAGSLSGKAVLLR
jgi:hypothetical protein